MGKFRYEHKDNPKAFIQISTDNKWKARMILKGIVNETEIGANASNWQLVKPKKNKQ